MLEPGNMEKSCISHLADREISRTSSLKFKRNIHINDHLLQNLQLETVLEGHAGCVNCLDWNEEGSLLASGSDDTNVILWDPLRHKSIQTVPTQHHGNIFSVKFMPCTGDHMIATGAADGHIFVHDLVGKETVCAYNVNGRVKRLATTRAEPNVIISAAEDGFVREYDIRDHSTSSAKTLVDLTKVCGGNAECKCVAVSPTNPNCMAVGANDPYVRIYDRRMMDMHMHAMYFIPGHLHTKQAEGKRQARSLCVTYVTFNARGSEILVNLGGEQVYVYDIYDRVTPLLLEAKVPHKCNGVNKRQTAEGSQCTAESNQEHCKPKRSRNGKASTSSDPDLEGTRNGKYLENFSISSQDSKTKATSLSDIYRVSGNDLFGEQKYTAAIYMYNKAILLAPSSILYSNRAAAFIKRSWDGDLYSALKDCYSALHANPGHVKAHFRLARCMFELKWFEKASSCIKEFKSHHPEHSCSNACLALEKDIKIALKQKEIGSKKSKNGQGKISVEEEILRHSCYDYSYRYCGHCNTTTDIKEANFFGSNGQYIVAGSDEGSFFIWERETTNLMRVMQGDSSIVNCLQPHPSSCMLATSGIDPVVKLWSPMESTTEEKHVLADLDSIASENQKRMNTDPLESMLISMGMRFVTGDDDTASSEGMACRTS